MKCPYCYSIHISAATIYAICFRCHQTFFLVRA